MKISNKITKQLGTLIAGAQTTWHVNETLPLSNDYPLGKYQFVMKVEQNMRNTFENKFVLRLVGSEHGSYVQNSAWCIMDSLKINVDSALAHWQATQADQRYKFISKHLQGWFVLLIYICGNEYTYQSFCSLKAMRQKLTKPLLCASTCGCFTRRSNIAMAFQASIQ